MTQPGTTGNAIPRGRDWIARDLADLRRMIRRLGASQSTTSGGGIVGTAYYSAPAPDFGYNDFSAAPDTTGDASCFAYDAGTGGVALTADGVYSCFAVANLSGLDSTTAGRIRLVSFEFTDTEGHCYGIGSATLEASSPPFVGFSGDLAKVHLSLPAGSPGSPAVTLAALYLVRWS